MSCAGGLRLPACTAPRPPSSSWRSPRSSTTPVLNRLPRTGHYCCQASCMAPAQRESHRAGQPPGVTGTGSSCRAERGASLRFTHLPPKEWSVACARAAARCAAIRTLKGQRRTYRRSLRRVAGGPGRNTHIAAVLALGRAGRNVGQRDSEWSFCVRWWLVSRVAVRGSGGGRGAAAVRVQLSRRWPPRDLGCHPCGMTVPERLGLRLPRTCVRTSRLPEGGRRRTQPPVIRLVRWR
jgi:hypothetical protein